MRVFKHGLGFFGTSAAGRLTIDFGFVPRVTIGNLVFDDANNDGLLDPNVEVGIEGVTVELWTNATNATASAATTTTLYNGTYSFSVAPGGYYIKIPASEFAEGMPLANRVPSKPYSGYLPENTNGDDDTAQDAYTSGTVLTDGARTPLFTVLKDTAPTTTSGETGYLSEGDDFDDANADLTVDLGFSPKPLTVGNIVFRDLDGDAKYNAADFGVPNVVVKLYKTGDDPNNASTQPVAQTTTAADGSFQINAYAAGTYFLHLPKSEFAAGKPLFGTSPLPGAGGDDGIDDSTGQNGLFTTNAINAGVSTATFDLDYGTEPTTTESGFLGSSDDITDTDADLTIDFGFSGGATLQLMSIGNFVFNDANHNLVADAGEGVPNVWMLLHLNQEFPNGTVNYIRSTYTDANGRYVFNNLNPGEYIVHVAADNFKASAPHMGGAPGPLYRKLSLRHTKTGDDNTGEDGLDDEQPELRGISSGIVTLTTGSAPAGAAEPGFQGTSDDTSGDNMTDLTIDFGFDTRIAAGNLVFRDNNADGKFAAGTDTPLSNILVYLRHVDTTTGIHTTISKSTTGTDGSYLVVGPPALAPHRYYIHIPAIQFAAGGPLEFLTPTSFTTFGDDDNQNQNLLPSANPETDGASTEISNVDILPGQMPTDANNEETGFNKTSDNDDDANIDLTIDLGLKPKAMMVGNLVFRDVNGNNIFDSGIDVPMSGVTVRLFQASQPITATPVSEAVTGPNGTYMLYATAPAAYYVHIPATMFGLGAPLNGLTSLVGIGGTGSSANTALDDLYDENGLDNLNLGLDGIRTANFNLAYGTMPLNTTGTQTSGENGYEAQMDDLADSSGMMTIDFGFQLLNIPPLANTASNNISTDSAASAPANTFAAWNTQKLDPLGDADSDGLSNLLEYALGTPAAHGHHAARFQLVQNSTTGLIDAVFSRAATTLADVRYSLETSSDLQTWKTVTTTPRLAQVNGLVQSTTAAIDQNAAAGFIRLKVALDADLNGTPESVTTSAIHAWSRMQALPGRQTLSMPLLRPAIFRGTVQIVNENTLVILNGDKSIHDSFTAGEKYFVEVLSGPLAGQTLDIDTAESTGNTLTLTSAADARLAGARIAIRPHHTLATLIPADSLCGAAESASADRVMFFDTTVNAFRVFWIKSDGTSLQWVREGDATLADACDRVVRPQEGMLLQIRDQASTITLFGELRLTPEPPASGTQFRGTGAALPQAPSSLEVRPGSKLRLWSGDTDPASGTYWNYQLDASSDWIDARTNLDVSTQKLLLPFRAYFLTPAN